MTLAFALFVWFTLGVIIATMLAAITLGVADEIRWYLVGRDLRKRIAARNAEQVTK